MYEVRKSNYEDVLYLKDRLRKEDVEELKLLGSTPEKSLTEGYYFSEYCYTGTFKNKPVAMFGAGSIKVNCTQKTGVIWLLATPDVELYKIEFLRICKEYFNRFKAEYDLLINVIDERNTKYIKWLKWLGFKFSKPFEVSGGQLIPFSHKIR